MKIVPDLFDTMDINLDKHGISWGYFCLNKPVAVDLPLIEQLKAVALEKHINVRICLHESADNSFHNMVIVQHKSAYYPPHKHPSKAECYHIIEGQLGAVHFNDAGEVTHSNRINTDSNVIYRIGLNENHAIFPLTDIAVYHESKPGPFNRMRDFVEPSWAPKADQEQLKKEFMVKMHAIFEA